MLLLLILYKVHSYYTSHYSPEHHSLLLKTLYYYLAYQIDINDVVAIEMFLERSIPGTILGGRNSTCYFRVQSEPNRL